MKMKWLWSVASLLGLAVGLWWLTHKSPKGEPAIISSTTPAPAVTAAPDKSAPALAEVASFWLSHRNIDPEESGASVTRSRAKDSARAAREVAALQAIGRWPRAASARAAGL